MYGCAYLYAHAYNSLRCCMHRSPACAHTELTCTRFTHAHACARARTVSECARSHVLWRRLFQVYGQVAANAWPLACGGAILCTRRKLNWRKDAATCMCYASLHLQEEEVRDIRCLKLIDYSSKMGPRHSVGSYRTYKKVQESVHKIDKNKSWWPSEIFMSFKAGMG